MTKIGVSGVFSARFSVMHVNVLASIVFFSLVNLSICSQGYNTLWPLPQTYLVEPAGTAVLLSTNFTIETNQSSAVLNRAIQRYTSIIMESGVNHLACINATVSIDKLYIEVASQDESLSVNTSYSYSLVVDEGNAKITASTIYGAMYGMETFSQYSDNGCFNYTTLGIQDYPQYRHRGLMIDAGRRFFPVELIQNLLDAMSYLKMNVLHFHFSDLCQFSVESMLYPELTSTLQQYYTQQDVKDLIQYASDRGIRILPEIDVPGHSRGMRPLANKSLVQYCTSHETELYNDPEHTTLNTLQKLLSEMMGLFPDEYFHIGCDETVVVDNCTLEGISQLETSLLNHISDTRTPIGWEEVLFTSKAATAKTVVEAWSRYTAGDVVMAQHYAIEASSHHFYLNLKIDYKTCWVDIAPNFTDKQLSLMLGGEMAMWTDQYCRTRECLDAGGPLPVAYWMYDKKYNDVFMQSIGGMIWPRGIVAAGSFWNFNDVIDPTSEDFSTTLFAQNKRMEKRGTIVCPNGCECDELHRCGVPYQH